MSELVKTLLEYLNEHWMKVVSGAALMAVSWYFGKRKARSEWNRREFLGRLNFSLNSIHDGTLLIRTLSEKSCADVFLNQVAVEQVLAASKQTTLADPTLPLAKDDYWFYLNSVLNELSEQFSQGVLRRDLGLQVKSEKYLVALTCEADGEIRTRKVRAMVIRAALLTNLPEEAPKFEKPHHKIRWTTLKTLAKLYQTEPHKFIEVELALG